MDRLSLRDGVGVGPEIFVVAVALDQVGALLVIERAEKVRAWLRARSVRETEGIRQALFANPDRAAASETFRAMQGHVEMFGLEQVSPADDATVADAGSTKERAVPSPSPRYALCVHAGVFQGLHLVQETGDLGKIEVEPTAQAAAAIRIRHLGA